ncbi:PAS/PAC sensor hybrid histidine kinase [Desulfatibacillum aliphaticivorans]|uniref:histidine kinase n=1 Tax=Desulfatibacillum aliphaticivorans TaxID=218208 RepID=B8FI33_DESAL|nr:PAS domain-containing sensor histidine kinase [Desulfatibacillum aliphaticivorans]ACL02600.1 PAS/PAC sensor hybrid histidine kinase [Desulfatibacillum aliphaticivorans]
MTETIFDREQARELRRIAEEKAARRRPAVEDLSPEEVRRLLHELQVHQIELEMQNEELRRTQLELESSREMYFDLYDLAPVGYCTISEKGLILEANMTAASLLGAARGSLITEPFSRYIFPGDQDIYYNHRKTLFKTRSPQVCELRLLDAEKNPKWSRLEAAVAQTKDGNPVCRMVISDIDAHKQAEEKQQNLEDQLHHAQKMESVGRLAGGVAHDFNNMLMIIIGYADLLLADKHPNDPEQDPLKQILSAAVRARNLTKQLLSFARKQVMTLKPMDLNEVIRGFRQMMNRMVGEDVAVDFALEETPLWVKADVSLIEQILMNMAVNAKDAMPRGGRLLFETMTVELDEPGICSNCLEVTPGRYALLKISDTGLGMDPETAQNCFEPFFTTKAMGKGTGLGLSTVYGIVKQHLGDVKVLSQPGTGTTFMIYLPIGAQAPVPLPSPEKARDDVPGKSTIMVIEDEAAVRRLACKILRRKGYNVIESEDGESALSFACAYNKPIHLVLSDVIMPGLKGPEIMNGIIKYHPEAKALFMSGYSEEHISSENNQKYNHPFISKPFSGSQLLAEVAKILSVIQ